MTPRDASDAGRRPLVRPGPSAAQRRGAAPGAGAGRAGCGPGWTWCSAPAPPTRDLVAAAGAGRARRGRGPRRRGADRGPGPPGPPVDGARRAPACSSPCCSTAAAGVPVAALGLAAAARRRRGGDRRCPGRPASTRHSSGPTTCWSPSAARSARPAASSPSGPATDAVVVGVGLNVSLRAEELPVPTAGSLALAGAVEHRPRPAAAGRAALAGGLVRALARGRRRPGGERSAGDVRGRAAPRWAATVRAELPGGPVDSSARRSRSTATGGW